MSESSSSPRQGNKVLINLAEVTKIYHNAAGSFTALDNINLTFFEGEFVGVIGKSGSGKSTLVNMITGIDRPTEGKVVVDGNDIHKMKESVQARWRGLNLGVVFQFFQLLPMLTLVENVLLPMDFCDRYDLAERLPRALSLLEMVGLADDANKLPGNVSGGQQQSAAIARALANDPRIIVADEPTGNLDAKTADSVYDTFETLANEGRTIIMITHDPEIEHRLSRKVLLSDGVVIDPILVRLFPWLPRPVLRVLGHALLRRTLIQGQRLDLDKALADQLILVVSGELLATYLKNGRKEKQVRLSPGAYFAGADVIDCQLFSKLSAESMTPVTSIAILPWEVFKSELKDVADGQRKLQSHLQDFLLGKAEGYRNQTGVIG